MFKIFSFIFSRILVKISVVHSTFIQQLSHRTLHASHLDKLQFPKGNSLRALLALHDNVIDFDTFKHTNNVSSVVANHPQNDVQSYATTPHVVPHIRIENLPNDLLFQIDFPLEYGIIINKASVHELRIY